MLKKLLAAVLFCCTLLIPLSGNVYAVDKYLNGDTNYELAWKSADVGNYVDKSSIVCQIYNPPYYRLAANVIDYDYVHPHELTRYMHTVVFSYNYDTHQIYQEEYDGYPAMGPLNSSNLSSNAKIKAFKQAKIIWKTAYNMNW